MIAIKYGGIVIMIKICDITKIVPLILNYHFCDYSNNGSNIFCKMLPIKAYTDNGAVLVN